MKRLFITLGFALSLATAATYQENAINVKAEESLRVKPDQAVFSVRISANHAQADSAILQVKPAFEAVAKVFAKYKLDAQSAVVKEMTIRSLYEGRPMDGGRDLKGYEVSRRYEVRFRDMAKLSAFLVDLRLAGATDFGEIEFSHTRLDSLQQVVLNKALVKSRQIAQGIAAVSGQRIGVPSVVSNEPVQEFSYENRVRIDLGSFDAELLRGKALMMSSMPRSAGGGGAPSPEMAQLAALQQFFQIDIADIEVKNQVWVTYPIVK